MVGLPARLLGDKGVREFVAAARLSREAGHDADWRLIGALDPDNPSAISRDELDAWLAEGVVSWSGFQSDMAAAFAALHIVVLPSYREGMPKALLEAAAAGRAIVTTDVPGCREAVDEGRAGLLVPARDAAALFDAVQTLLVDPAKRMRLGNAARALAVERFDERAVIQSTLDLYASLG